MFRFNLKEAGIKMSTDVVQTESTIANDSQNLQVDTIEAGLDELNLVNDRASNVDKGTANESNGGLDSKQKKKYDKLIGRWFRLVNGKRCNCAILFSE